MRWAVGLLALAGCLRGADYRCARDPDCSAGGHCEATGYCSFASDACASGRRYGALSGALADRCVGDGEPAPGPDAPAAAVDAPGDAAPDSAGDAAPDAPPLSACPAGYAALPGVATHAYRRLPTAAPWVNQKAACASEGAQIHLAVPDDATEAGALAALAGGDVWVGIGDGASEGHFVTVLGAAATFLPWAPGEPDNNGNQDCVAILHASGLIETLACAANELVAVCECER